MQAGTNYHRRAAAAWAVHRWLRVSAERGRLLSGPRPHWWPLLHFAAVFVALCSGLCDLSSNSKQCMAATTSIVAIIVALNIVPVVIALRWSIPPCTKSAGCKPAMDHLGDAASHMSSEEGAATPQDAQSLRIRIVRPVRRFLRLPDPSTAYRIDHEKDLAPGGDLPVIVRLRRDGLPDLPSLSVPSEIKARPTIDAIVYTGPLRAPLFSVFLLL